MKNHTLLAVTIGAVAVITVGLLGQSGKPAQSTAGNGTLLDDLVVANRILANENILDGLGHISVRSLQRPDHFFLSRDLADILALSGGVPIQIGNDTIGAVGSAGSNLEMDDACARAGIAKVKDLLK